MGRFAPQGRHVQSHITFISFCYMAAAGADCLMRLREVVVDAGSDDAGFLMPWSSSAGLISGGLLEEAGCLLTSSLGVIRV